MEQRQTKRMFMTVFLAVMFLLTAAQTKTVSILGDSYSTFDGFITPSNNLTWYFDNVSIKKNDVVKVEQTWWHQLISKKQWKLCMNNSYSGSTICNTGYGNADYSDRSFVTRMPNLGCPDIILIFGATNDSWAHSPIGEYKYEGITKDDLMSFRPAMARLLQWMKARYINTQIVFILNNDLSKDINESVDAICRHYDIPVIRLQNIDKIAGHPSVKGMQQIAEQIGAQVE